MVMKMCLCSLVENNEEFLHDVEDIFTTILLEESQNDVFTLNSAQEKDDDDDDERKEELKAALIEFTRYDVGHVAHLPGRPET